MACHSGQMNHEFAHLKMQTYDFILNKPNLVFYYH